MKKIVTISILLLLSASIAFAQVAASINKEAELFMKDFTNISVNLATNQNVYADAYIGKFFPSIPPHFAAGGNVGFAELDLSNLGDAAAEIGIPKLGNLNKVFVPYPTLDARIGGLILPFDLGVSGMILPKINDYFGMSLDFLTVGANLRYAVLEENIIFPHVSLGVAYYYARANMKASLGPANFNFNHEINTLSLSAQVSKSFIIATPFIGGRFTMTDAKNTFDYDAAGIINEKVSYNTGLTDLTSTNVYAGVAFNILVLKLTPSVSYDITNNMLTGAFSVRAQL